MMSPKSIFMSLAILWAAAVHVFGQDALPTLKTTVRGRVEVVSENSAATKHHAALPATVVWLTPVTSGGGEETNSNSNLSPSVTPPRLVQKNKSFEPHILVVPAGSMVEFPNRDPFFHNVFSLFEGKRFDLGLYEAGTSRMVRFDRPGISYIFCNIHSQMSAVVITIAAPFYAISSPSGQLNLTGVPYGRYVLHIWSEGMGPENDHHRTREITIAENATSLGVVRVPEATDEHIGHKNKYGREYDEPTPNNSIYDSQQ